MSRGVSAEVFDAGVASDSGACWTIVVVLVSPPTPNSATPPMASAPPSTAAVSATGRRARGEFMAAAVCPTQLKRSQTPPQRFLKLVVGSDAGQGARRLLRVGRPHEALAHEHRVDADALEVLELLARVDARLGDDGLAGGHVDEQLVGALQVDREVGE